MHGSAALPDITRGRYIRDAFLSLGMANNGPLQWSEIDAFARLTQEIGEPWEAHLVRAMSIEYLGWLENGKDPFAIPPYELRQA